MLAVTAVQCRVLQPAVGLLKLVHTHRLHTLTLVYTHKLEQSCCVLSLTSFKSVLCWVLPHMNGR
jgi:hypothetical protein